MATWRFFFVVVLLMFFLARRGDNTQSRGRSFMLMGQQLWGKHTCSRTNKNGRRTVKLMWLLHRGEKQVVPTVSFWRAHTEAVFIGCSPYLHTDDCCANVGQGRRRRDARKNRGRHANVRLWLQLRELRLEGSLNVFRYSPFDPYIRLYLYTRSVYMCGFFFGGLYIYML